MISPKSPGSFHWRTVFKSQDLGAQYILIQISPSILYKLFLKKKINESVLMRLKLKPIIQSEVSQKDKDQYSILMHIYGI